MRKTKRLGLSAATVGVLADMQKRVNKASTPSQEAVRLWEKKTSSHKRKNAFLEVNRMLAKMASGRSRCMYCEDNEGTDIEHFWPRSTYPASAFEWANYLLACSGCNSNEKRAQFPVDSKGMPMLVNPVDDEPVEHFILVPETGYLIGTTERGVASEDVFGLNRRESLVDGRRDAFVTVCVSLRAYHRARLRNRDAYAKQIATALARMSFASVLQFIVNAEVGHGVPPDVVEIVKLYPEVRQWAGLLA